MVFRKVDSLIQYSEMCLVSCNTGLRLLSCHRFLHKVQVGRSGGSFRPPGFRTTEPVQSESRNQADYANREATETQKRNNDRDDVTVTAAVTADVAPAAAVSVTAVTAANTQEYRNILNDSAVYS